MSKVSERPPSGVFFALGDETRLSLLRKLGVGKALSATVLSGGAGVTRQAIVKHLRVLEDAGLVTHERRGREVLYTLEARRLEEARAFLKGISAGWDRAIERLRRMVEKPPRGQSSRQMSPRTPGGGKVLVPPRARRAPRA
jgi:DNA-binding transcriptional ArsR family regulator